MEFLALSSCAFMFIVFKQKKIRFKNLRFPKFIQEKLDFIKKQRQNDLNLINETIENERIPKEEEYRILNGLKKNFSCKILNFDSFEKVAYMNIKTDADLYGGDTEAEADFNIVDKSRRILK